MVPSYTTARVLYYPPLPSPAAIKPGQLRCGEHVDYGSITLLFQDPSGGLQVYSALILVIIVRYRNKCWETNLTKNWET